MPNDLFTVPEESREVATKEDRLLETVLASGNIEVLERYIALRKSEEERQARIAFEKDFALMQQELPPIIKRKDNAGTHSKYAQIEDVQNGWNPTIKKWGFAYSWRSDPIEGKDGWVRTYMDIRKYGHTQTNSIDLPPLTATESREGKKVQNDLQTVGGQASYGRRYTLIPGFGGVVEGEDNDGERLDEGSLQMDLQEFIKSGKLNPDAVAIITKELMKGKPGQDGVIIPGEPDISKLRNYWKRARAKVEGK
jgi:hypothetical protein